MTGLIARIAARTAGEAPRAAPRIPSRFEPLPEERGLADPAAPAYPAASEATGAAAFDDGGLAIPPVAPDQALPSPTMPSAAVPPTAHARLVPPSAPADRAVAAPPPFAPAPAASIQRRSATGGAPAAGSPPPFTPVIEQALRIDVPTASPDATTVSPRAAPGRTPDRMATGVVPTDTATPRIISPAPAAQRTEPRLLAPGAATASPQSPFVPDARPARPVRSDSVTPAPPASADQPRPASGEIESAIGGVRRAAPVSAANADDQPATGALSGGAVAGHVAATAAPPIVEIHIGSIEVRAAPKAATPAAPAAPTSTSLDAFLAQGRGG